MIVEEGKRYLVALGAKTGELTEVDILQVLKYEEEYKPKQTFYKVKGYNGKVGWVRSNDIHVFAELGETKSLNSKDGR